MRVVKEIVLISEKEKYKLVFYQSVVTIFVLFLLVFFQNYLFNEGSLLSLSGLLKGMSIVSLLIFLLNFFRASPFLIFTLFLANASLSMLIVRSTGSSASPFLILFSLLALSVGVFFKLKPKPYFFLALMAATLALMSMSIGFGPSILGHGFSVLATGILGLYLTTALDQAGLALSKSAQEKLRLENLQKAIMANIPSALLSTNTHGKIIQVNKVAIRVLEKTEDEILGAYVYELIPELEKLRKQLEDVTSINDSFEAMTDRKVINFHRQSDQAHLKLAYSLARLTDPKTLHPIGTLILFQDLTQVIRLDEELKHSEKLAAIGKLAAGIAHEIRNPLAGISGGAQLLEGSLDLKDDDKKLLNIIQKESSRLDLLITDLLEYVKPKSADLLPLRYAEVVERVCEGLELSQKWKNTGAKIILEGTESTSVLGDASKLNQVLLNLFINAGQAGAKTVRVIFDEKNILKIVDDGPGIPVEKQREIFEPFFTTKQEGTGLGLAVSHRAIEDMKGQIDITSPVPGYFSEGGTMFKIELRGSNNES